MRELVITDNAKEDIEHIASVLKTQFSNQVKTDFLVNISENCFLLKKCPLCILNLLKMSGLEGVLYIKIPFVIMK